MRDVVLYRKYRPKTFNEVLGQDQVVKTLEGALKLGQISHAYLFAGSRGTGKTSVARILARELGTAEADLYEIDAASNRGIDDVRAIREAVSTLPFESKYKIYIVDEVHMLTKEAFNALLKTIEEPPPHVIFILATTEMEKLPETVVSRCQVFQFRRPSQAMLKEMVARVALAEGFSLEPESTGLIALLADGSFRDAQGILEKVISSSRDKKVSVEEVEMVTGAPRGKLINDFLSALAGRDAAAGLKTVALALEADVDMKVFLKIALRKLRFVLLLRYAREMETDIRKELSPEDFEFLKKLVERKDSQINAAALLELLNAYDLVNFSYLPQLPIELAVVKLAGESAR